MFALSALGQDEVDPTSVAPELLKALKDLQTQANTD